jgi:FHA domain/Double zinc ribbon
MIVCPNCSHSNPDGAVQCEACYTPLPATMGCPSCGSTVQVDATFCGQCGFNLRSATASSNAATGAATGTTPVPATVAVEPKPDIPSLISPDPLVKKSPVSTPNIPDPDPSALPPTSVSTPLTFSPPTSQPPIQPSQPPIQPNQPPIQPSQSVGAPLGSTQLQLLNARLIHVQTDRPIELPQNLSVVHMGKPNDRIPPDIDVSGFPNSEIVSRIHADIRMEGDSYYLEDVGSANGTYVNNLPLLPGNRHRLRPGDRISLGKGDLVTFLFQMS